MRFPNPEESGAMDHVLDLARKVDAELVIANRDGARARDVADRVGILTPPLTSAFAAAAVAIASNQARFTSGVASAWVSVTTETHRADGVAMIRSRDGEKPRLFHAMTKRLNDSRVCPLCPLCPAHHRGCYGCFGPMEAPNPGALSDHLGLDERDVVRLFRTFYAAAPAFGESDG